VHIGFGIGIAIAIAIAIGRWVFEQSIPICDSNPDADPDTDWTWRDSWFSTRTRDFATG
jgi:hypothetical protein